MFIIKNEDGVFWGPKIWDKHEMQSIINSKYNIDFPLQWANPNEKVIQVNDNVSIWPVIFVGDPSYDKKTQTLDGPFYDYTDTHAEQYHTVVDMSLEEMKMKSREVVNNARKFFTEYKTPVTINGSQYAISVSESKRRDFDFGVPGNWKLNKITSTDTSRETYPYDFYETMEEWVTLTQDDLDTISLAIKNFIQQQFDTIKEQYDAIDAFTSAEDVSNHNFPNGIRW